MVNDKVKELHSAQAAAMRQSRAPVMEKKLLLGISPFLVDSLKKRFIINPNAQIFQVN